MASDSKVLEAQSAMLTNYEVYKFLIEQRERHAKLPKSEGKRPGNFETLAKEVIEYLEAAPSPLKPLTYTDDTIYRLLERLRPYNLTKPEILMIMNLRPTTPELLNTCIEELETRFPGDEEQNAIGNAIAEVLGKPDAAAETMALKENADDARKQSEQEAGLGGANGMDVDGS